MSEFQVGDWVTYKPYETKIKMIVKYVRKFRGFGPRVELDIPEYELSMGTGFGVTSVTTGRSIMESLYYKED